MRLGTRPRVITLRPYEHMFPVNEDRTRNVLDAAHSPEALCGLSADCGGVQ